VRDARDLGQPLGQGRTEWIESDVPIPEQLDPDFGARLMHPHSDKDRVAILRMRSQVLKIYEASGGAVHFRDVSGFSSLPHVYS